MKYVNHEETRFWEGEYMVEGLKVQLDYNHGEIVRIFRPKKEGEPRMYQNFETENWVEVFNFYNKANQIDYRKVFSLKNVFKYYKYQLLQRIFWYNSARGREWIANFMRNKTKLTDYPYPINKNLVS